MSRSVAVQSFEDGIVKPVRKLTSFDKDSTLLSTAIRVVNGLVPRASCAGLV
jgi:hypothetical protein